ncbi:sulfide/dihydroorotate dehydrogenase-like FAD/NAD-binding protein [Syntrophotalea acetylenica]|uniref:sulfide/dihydroorotate dehydrogenase-like FAD/NAD-binding protein n=1 Tax=Syntrophotalea acetylenica TaxID=29542 RepID=UPI002A35CE4C|nr:sulfide/dihydroorotate dehydrogenase-like FAD/NAD-binding protein [Syntrophotalea acetylenica]MDY0260903.1 sulfide/dihydroorotate dehydrogenase-like FAD/NAD-binding protein [Syntrophotalea acetylenica]
MFEILSNDILAPNVHRMVIRAPRIARVRKPGQFVIVRVEEGGERIPLTIGDADIAKGTITLFIQAVGLTSLKLVGTPVGNHLRDVAGPLGQPTHIRKWGRVVCIGGGLGTAVLYPMARALPAAGNEVTTIIGGRSAPFIILEQELSVFSRQVLVTTEDGSLGRKGFVTDALRELIDDPQRCPQAVIAIGPVPMMRAVAELTRPYGIETIVSLNPIMIDGTGMCGGCRVVVGGETRFACVDGPEFDGHLVDFDLLSNRLAMYREDECRMLEQLPDELRARIVQVKR